MGTKLFSFDDVYRILHNTVCRYKGKPVYVSSDGLSDVVRIQTLDGTPLDTNQVDHTSPSFDYSAPPLGYWFDGFSCSYLTRRPTRQWRAGVTSAVIRQSQPLGGGYILTKATSECIEGKHTSYDDALSRVLSRVNVKVPFNRHFAVGITDGRVGLYHRDTLIGFYNKGSKKFNLFGDNGVSVVLIALKRAGFNDIVEF